MSVIGYSEDIFELHILSVIWDWVVTFHLLGSLCNRIIYFWRVKKLRRAALKILHYKQLENSPPPIELVQVKRYRPEVQPSTAEAFSSPVNRQELVQLSFSNSLIIHATLNQPEHLILVRWTSLETQ